MTPSRGNTVCVFPKNRTLYDPLDDIELTWKDDAALRGKRGELCPTVSSHWPWKS